MIRECPAWWRRITGQRLGPRGEGEGEWHRGLGRKEGLVREREKNVAGPHGEGVGAERVHLSLLNLADCTYTLVKVVVYRLAVASKFYIRTCEQDTLGLLVFVIHRIR
jgi:hypothetical protein